MFDRLPLPERQNAGFKYYRNLLATKDENDKGIPLWRLKATLEQMEETIAGEVKAICNRFVNIGCMLADSDSTAMYRYTLNAKNTAYCKDIYEYCKTRFGLQKTSTFNLLGIARRFASGGKLRERWSQYSYSQLCEMLPMSDEDIKQVTPTMTVKQIRELKHTLALRAEGDVVVEQSDDDDVEYVVQKSQSEALIDLLLYGAKKFLDSGVNNYYSFAEWLLCHGVYVNVSQAVVEQQEV